MNVKGRADRAYKSRAICLVAVIRLSREVARSFEFFNRAGHGHLHST
jgi:hypothetical protein